MLWRRGSGSRASPIPLTPAGGGGWQRTTLNTHPEIYTLSLHDALPILYSMLGAQSVTSKDDVVAAVLGKQSFTDPLHAGWWTRLQETRDHKCWNNDINSLELYQAQQLWVDGKAAMTITAGTDAPNFVAKAG